MLQYVTHVDIKSLIRFDIETGNENLLMMKDLFAHITKMISRSKRTGIWPY